MGFRRVVALGLASCTLFSVSTPDLGEAQETDRIWGRVHTAAGEIREGFIRWDRNEGVWADLLDGSKASPELKYQDWWNLGGPTLSTAATSLVIDANALLQQRHYRVVIRH